ncbi:stage III sporulation protein AG [Pullulanibacillus pueri]|uniref:Stage III sporulation protein AG n=1 Tax=Pullulanibacillus pueri TaxID=1437324 RepID=A0A8J2ZUL8_9BACL|nr:stage III sporulation protein AG [Pullulanibacillus pueri]MBM7681590.1 stage III sporulation protein AG [Pullulanibacillus pueri]GGH79550.1 hypothetical protein GCM10007096_14640 [Pullulanibacillus pueri]
MSLQKLLQYLKSLFLTEKSEKPAQKKKKSPLQTLVILLVIGVGLMLMSHFYGSGSGKSTEQKAVETTSQTAEQDMATFKTTKQKTFSSFEDYASYYEDHLTNILNEVMGVSNVHVWVTIDTTMQNVYGENTDTQTNQTNEEDKDGGTRVSNEKSSKHDVVIIDGKPLVVTQKSPVVKGVWVVAYGVDNPTVKSWIVDAVSSVLSIPSYKVSVTQAKSKEE